MSTAAENLYQAALKLPEDERIHLAGRLLESVEPERDPDWEAAWSEVIGRRIEEVESGKVKTMSWEEVERRIHEVRHGRTDAERDPNYEEAWSEEIRRRVEEIDNGTAKMIPWEEVRAKLRERLDDVAGPSA